MIDEDKWCDAAKKAHELAKECGQEEVKYVNADQFELLYCPDNENAFIQYWATGKPEDSVY